jgi:hypothetical protein
MPDDDDYCVEEEEKEEEPPEEYAIGPKCDVCGFSTDSLYPVLVKRERKGRREMVQIYLCAYHLLEREENDALTSIPEEERKSDYEEYRKWMEEGPDDEEEDDDNSWDKFRHMCNVDREGQSWG